MSVSNGKKCKILCVVQSRYSSKRLPGKALQKICDQTILERVLNRLRFCQNINRLVVATSQDESDDSIKTHCDEMGVCVYRGSLENVVERILECGKNFNAEAIVRISGDSPLIDPDLVDELIAIFMEGDYDLVTNVQIRSFPKGQSVEIIKTSKLAHVAQKIEKLEDLEHVTSFIYQHPNLLDIKNREAESDFSKVQLSVDTPKDRELIEKMILLGGERLNWMEAANLYHGLVGGDSSVG